MEELIRWQKELDKRIERLETTAEQPVFVPLTDYSGTATYVGWSSFTTQVIYYSRDGKLVFVHFNVAGVSNSTSCTVSLPYTSAGAPQIFQMCRVRDNGTLAVGMVSILVSTATLSFRPSITAAPTAWTSSGNKDVLGEIFYWMA